MMQALEQELTVTNKLGLHARSAAAIVRELSKFKSRVILSKGNASVDGKSILDILTLNCPRGCKLRAKVIGEDAQQAMEALEGLFANKFGEE